MNDLNDYYQNKLLADFSALKYETFSSTDLSLIDLANFLHEISSLNKKYQEIEFSEDFISKLDTYEKAKLYQNIVATHKKLTHFILKNKGANASS